MNAVRARGGMLLVLAITLATLLPCLAVASTPRRALASAAPANFEAPTLSCSTPLKLRDGTNQSGTLVLIYTRLQWVNLTDFDFNNMTSSYTVGACAVILASGTNGGGSLYAECLNAGCVEDVMLTGWNNVLSSVYLR